VAVAVVREVAAAEEDNSSLERGIRTVFNY
jgi:hypothetical protein